MPNSHSITELEAEVADLKHRNAVLFERIAQQSRAAEAARGGR